jgi:hypothetical protein
MPPPAQLLQTRAAHEASARPGGLAAGRGWIRVIAVCERDPASGYSFLQIAESCRSHGDDHARAGLCAARARCVSHAARHTSARVPRQGVPPPRAPIPALEQSLAAFAARPWLETYQKFAIDARTRGKWPERHTAALDHGRPPASPAAGNRAHHPSLRPTGHSKLICILPWATIPTPPAAPSTSVRGARSDACQAPSTSRPRRKGTSPGRHVHNPSGSPRIHEERHTSRVQQHMDLQAFQLLAMPA